MVTGSGRAGTSMLMQTLRIWKYPVAGVAFHSDFPIESLNLKGYWDLPFSVMMNGIGKEFSDMGIKIFGHWLCRVSPENVNKMVVCKRRSTQDQDASLMHAFEEEIKVSNNSIARNIALQSVPSLTDLGVIRRKNYREIRKFLKKNKHIDSTTVYFEDVLKHPEVELPKLAEFLELSPTTMKEAIDNIDKK